MNIYRKPTLNDYVVTVHYKYSNSPQICDYLLAQAKDLFPTLIAWHIHMTSGSTETDPKLLWAIDHWRSTTTANRPTNYAMNQQMDLNVLYNLRTHVSNKKAKLNHLATELIVKVGYGDNSNKTII
jgi:hypothetical protein